MDFYEFQLKRAAISHSTLKFTIVFCLDQSKKGLASFQQAFCFANLTYLIKIINDYQKNTERTIITFVFSQLCQLVGSLVFGERLLKDLGFKGSDYSQKIGYDI